MGRIEHTVLKEQVEQMKGRPIIEQDML